MIASRGSSRVHVTEGLVGVRRPRTRGRRGRPPAQLGTSSPSRVRTLDSFLKENSSSLTFLGITLGIFISRKFFALPVAVAAMLAQDTLGMEGLSRARKAVRG